MRATLITGAPGTGKTTRIIDTAADYLSAGGDPARLLVLTPTRAGATRIRDGLARRTETSMSTAPTRAWSAYAFDLLRRAHLQGLLPGVQFTPKLLSGPEQDVMISEILAGHRAGEGAAIHWPNDLHQALGTRGFRHEIRDFFDRMAEYELTADHVHTLADQANQPAWHAVAALHTEYRQIRTLRAPHSYDPAALIHEACKTLLANPSLLLAERERFHTVLLDDAQELSPATYRLLRILCGHNSALVLKTYSGNNREEVQAALAPAPNVLITCCTETVVQGFRGARPDMAGTLGTIFPHLIHKQLSTSYRMVPPIAHAWKEIARRLPVVPGAPTERQLTYPPKAIEEVPLLALSDDGDLLDPRRYQALPEGIFGYTMNSPQDEAHQIAQLLLEDYLYRGAAYHRSAIIVRSTTEVARIRRILGAAGIPTATSAALVPVRDEPAVRPFLDALALLIYARSRSTEQLRLPDDPPNTASAGAPGEKEETAQEELNSRSIHDVLAEENRTNPGSAAHNAITLLTSRLGGASSMDVRRLRQQLRAAELRAGGRRSSDDLLLGALLNPDALPQYGTGAAVNRVARVLTAGQRALNEPGGNAETVLWALWQASGLEKIWVADSDRNGPQAERAHRNLDAMIGLFESATRFVDQMPGASAEQFLDYIDAQDLPMDTLATRGQRHDAVEILTPALATGREWDTVYVCGVQEGSWPNTTVRGSLLGTAELTDICEIGVAAASAVRLSDRVRAVRHDELRMFSAAVSRARKRLVVTAVMSEDATPSEFFDLLFPDARAGQNTRVRRPMTLRAMVAQLRRQVAREHPAESVEYDYSTKEHKQPARNDPSLARAAAKLLHRLADEQVPGADPSQWWGMMPPSSEEPAFSTQNPAFEGDASARGGQQPQKVTVPVSPSRIETIHKSPLDWFVSAARAEVQTDTSRSLGTLIHAIAEKYPQADYTTLRAALEEDITALALPDTWEGEQTRRRAEKMIEKLAVYYNQIMPGDARTLVGVEGSFRVRVPGERVDARLSGRVDRLEQTADGRFVVVDVKTGRTKPSRAEIDQHAQLAAYQVAVEAGAGEIMSRQLRQQPAGQPEPGSAEPSSTASPAGLHPVETVFTGMSGRSGGAALVQLGDGTAANEKNRPQQQPALEKEGDEWAVELIQHAAELIAGAVMQARHRPGESCRLPEICPLCERGRQVTQG